MKDYYRQKIEITEEQLRLCKKGFIVEMKTAGNGLMNTDDMAGMAESVAKINKMKTAIDELEQVLASAQKGLQDYLSKEGGEE